MRIPGLLAALLLLMLLTIAEVTAVNYILEAKKATNFSPSVERLWEQAQEGYIRKDENGNFERFLRDFGQHPRAIQGMSSTLQLHMNMEKAQ